MIGIHEDSLVWDECADYLLTKLQKLQNRAARVMTGSSYETNSEDILSELNWQPLKLVFKLVYGFQAEKTIN